MIKELTIDDKDRFLYLGSLIKADFSKTNDLEKIVESDSEHVIGFYLEEGMVAFIYYSKKKEEEGLRIFYNIEHEDQNLKNRIAVDY